LIMRIQNDDERQAAAQTLKEVMRKLEEALRLSRELEETRHERELSGVSRG